MAFLLRHARRINVFVCAQLRSMGICSDSMTIKTSLQGLRKDMLMQGGLFCGFSPGSPGNAGLCRENHGILFPGI